MDESAASGGVTAALRAVTASLSSYALAGAPAVERDGAAPDRLAVITAMEELRGVLAAAQAAEVAQARRISPWQAARFVAFAEQAPELPGWGDRRVDQQARNAVYRIDPAGTVERRRHEHTQRRVSVRPAPECMAWVTTLMAMPDAVSLRVQLERDAAAMVAAGDPRLRAQIMSDLVVERVSGRGVAEGPAVAVELLVPVATLLGGDTPARFADGEPCPAPLARDLALGGASGSGTAARSVRRLFTDPAGRLVTAETASRQFTPAMRDLVRLRDGRCTTPWCDAPLADVDHHDPAARGGPTSIVNARGLCRWCNVTKADRPPERPVPAPTQDRCRPGRSHLERRVRRHVDREVRRTARRTARGAGRVLVDLPTAHHDHRG